MVSIPFLMKSDFEFLTDSIENVRFTFFVVFAPNKPENPENNFKTFQAKNKNPSIDLLFLRFDSQL